VGDTLGVLNGSRTDWSAPLDGSMQYGECVASHELLARDANGRTPLSFVVNVPGGNKSINAVIVGALLKYAAIPVRYKIEAVAPS
jgi:hypothetical protein